MITIHWTIFKLSVKFSRVQRKRERVRGREREERAKARDREREGCHWVRITELNILEWARSIATAIDHSILMSQIHYVEFDDHTVASFSYFNSKEMP